MRYFDSFSGIGGFTLGIQLAYDNRQKTNNEGGSAEVLPEMVSSTERNNVERPLSCIGYSEIDKYASEIYQSHFPYEQCTFCKEKEERTRKDEPQGVRDGEVFFNNERTEGLGDSTSTTQQHNINGTDRQLNNCQCKHKPYGDITSIVAEDLPDFDLLVGGVPCQSWSIAGKRGGFEDERGNMWFQYAKILRAKRPKYFVAENVKGLLSHDGGKSMERICEELCDCGYAIDFEVLNSKDFGVPQNRSRVFIIGFRLDLLDDMQIF